MDDPSGTVAHEHGGHACLITQIELAERESRLTLKLCQAGLFQPHIIIRIQVVEPDDLVAAREQPAADVKPDESGGAGDKNSDHKQQVHCDKETILVKYASGGCQLAVVGGRGTCKYLL